MYKCLLYAFVHDIELIYVRNVCITCHRRSNLFTFLSELNHQNILLWLTNTPLPTRKDHVLVSLSNDTECHSSGTVWTFVSALWADRDHCQQQSWHGQNRRTIIHKYTRICTYLRCDSSSSRRIKQSVLGNNNWSVVKPIDHRFHGSSGFMLQWSKRCTICEHYDCTTYHNNSTHTHTRIYSTQHKWNRTE